MFRINVNVLFFRFFSISSRNDKFNIDTINDRNDLLTNVNTIYFCNENDRNERENKKKIEKKRKNIKMKKEISAKIRNFEKFDFEKFKICKNLFLTQKTFIHLYNKMIDFSKKFSLKTMRIDFANMYCFEIFDFEFFEIWLMNDFWLITNLK